MVGVVGALRAANDMSPPCTNASTCGDVDDVVVFVVDTVIAGHAAIVYVLDGLFCP